VLADGLESADDEQRTPKADPMDVDEPGSGGRYPTSKLFQKRIHKILFRCFGQGKLGFPNLRTPATGEFISFGTDCSSRTA